MDEVRIQILGKKGRVKKLEDRFKELNHVKTTESKSLSESMDVLKENQTDLLYVDLEQVQRSNFFHLHDIIEKNPLTPLIVLGNDEDEKNLMMAVEQGASDFLTDSDIDKIHFDKVVKLANRKKKLLTDLNNEREKSLKLQKLAALGELSAGVAHELNNPIMILRYFADQIEKHLEQDQMDKLKLSKCCTDLKSSIERVVSIVSSLSNYSRDSKNDTPKQESISSIIKESVILCYEKFMYDNIQISYEFNNLENLEIKCRRSELMQVFINLLYNACDAIIGLDEKWIKFDLQETNDFLKIGITDSGKGISEEVQKSILKPFFTTKEKGQGTGLGLSIVKRILDRHAANIRLDSRYQNTRFIITLPK